MEFSEIFTALTIELCMWIIDKAAKRELDSTHTSNMKPNPGSETMFDLLSSRYRDTYKILSKFEIFIRIYWYKVMKTDSFGILVLFCRVKTHFPFRTGSIVGLWVQFRSNFDEFPTRTNDTLLTKLHSPSETADIF